MVYTWASIRGRASIFSNHLWVGVYSSIYGIRCSLSDFQNQWETNTGMVWWIWKQVNMEDWNLPFFDYWFNVLSNPEPDCTEMCWADLKSHPLVSFWWWKSEKEHLKTTTLQYYPSRKCQHNIKSSISKSSVYLCSGCGVVATKRFLEKLCYNNSEKCCRGSKNDTLRFCQFLREKLFLWNHFLSVPVIHFVTEDLACPAR